MGSNTGGLFMPDFPVTDGFVANYPFTGNAVDQSCYKNHGTEHGTVLTEDRFGNAYSAPAVSGSSYIEVPHSGSQDCENALTVTARAQSGEGALKKKTPKGTPEYHLETSRLTNRQMTYSIKAHSMIQEIPL